MSIYFFRGYVAIKQFSNQPYIFSYLFSKEISRDLLALLQLLFLTTSKLDDAGIVEIADFFKASLEDVSAYIPINLRKSIQLFQD